MCWFLGTLSYRFLLGDYYVNKNESERVQRV
jgi:hypothetical protein